MLLAVLVTENWFHSSTFFHASRNLRMVRSSGVTPACFRCCCTDCWKAVGMSMLSGRFGTLKILFLDLWHLQVDVHRAGGCHVGGEAVGREATSVEDGEVGRAEGLKLRLRRTNEHVVHEQAVVRSSRDHADPDAALRGWQREISSSPSRKSMSQCRV